MQKKKKTTFKMFTKQEIRKVVTLWENLSVGEIAKELDRKPASITYLAKKVRKCGYPLPKKYIKRESDSLVKITLKEMGLIK